MTKIKIELDKKIIIISKENYNKKLLGNNYEWFDKLLRLISLEEKILLSDPELRNKREWFEKMINKRINTTCNICIYTLISQRTEEYFEFIEFPLWDDFYLGEF